MYCNEKNHCHLNHCQYSCPPEHVTYNINNLHCCCGDKSGDGISSSGVPIGTIISYPASNLPSDYLECNGAVVEREKYQELFDILGESYGAGDGQTTFNLPDLRGEFIRGLDNGRGVDSDRVLGSAQGDAIRDITGTFRSTGNQATGAFTSSAMPGLLTGTGGDGHYDKAFKASNVVPTAKENRPRNVAMIYCIKAK